MDKMVQAIIDGQTFDLNYSMAVMFDMREKYGDIQSALDILQKDDREAFEAVQWFFTAMAQDGELCRRAEGWEPRPMPDEAFIRPQMRPYEYQQLLGHIVDAIDLGYHRETESDEDIDLGLEELNQKK